MERTIKFRGKRADNGEWVYGDLLRIGGGTIIYFGSPTETQTPDIPNSSTVAVELFNDEIAVVIPSSVGQYIGIKDNKGREIYEGDVFTVNGKYHKVIAFAKERASFCIANIDDVGDRYFYPWQFPSEDWWNDFNRDILVVGNIHEGEYKRLRKCIK